MFINDFFYFIFISFTSPKVCTPYLLDSWIEYLLRNHLYSADIGVAGSKRRILNKCKLVKVSVHFRSALRVPWWPPDFISPRYLEPVELMEKPCRKSDYFHSFLEFLQWILDLLKNALNFIYKQIKTLLDFKFFFVKTSKLPWLIYNP